MPQTNHLICTETGELVTFFLNAFYSGDLTILYDQDQCPMIVLESGRLVKNSDAENEQNEWKIQPSNNFFQQLKFTLEHNFHLIHTVDLG